MKKPEVVPERLENPISLKILGLIIGAALAFQAFLMTYPESEHTELIVFTVSFINPMAASVASFLIAKRYSGAKVFGRAYFSLGLAYLMVFFAEVTYLVYDLMLGLDPYPSIADIFFFALYPFTLIHLILNIRFFKPSLGLKTAVWMVLIPASIISTYTIVSFQEFGEANFDFFYGIIFIIGSTVTLAFAILGARIFKEGLLGTAWLLLVMGILATTIGDVWYYYLEVFEGYDLIHPVNLFWYASYWIIIYALIKHKSTF